jgi:hypothetical protein
MQQFSLMNPTVGQPRSLIPVVGNAFLTSGVSKTSPVDMVA